MTDRFLRNQDEQYIANDAWQFYSKIAAPSFIGFEELSPEENFVLEKFRIDPYVREIMLANLDSRQVKLAMMYFNIIIGCNMMKKLDEKLDLTPSGNLFSRKLLALVLLSMGTEQSFLKTMLTNYSISEQRMEERAYIEKEEEKKEEQKKEWRFPLPRGRR